MRFILFATLIALVCGTVSAATVAHYRFEDGTAGAALAVAVDETGVPAHDGSAVGAPVVFSSSVPTSTSLPTNNLSVFFDGSYGQAISFPFEFPLHLPGDATLEFFINVDHSTHDAILWTRPDSHDANRFNIFTTHPGTSTSFGFDYRTSWGGLHSIANPIAFSIELNTWTHIAIVRTGDSYEWFKDGVSEGSAVDAGPSLPNSGGWQLSGRLGFELRGYIDEVRLSDTALTPAEFLFSTAPTLSCTGFHPPMANYPVKVKGNRALPLKSNLYDAEGYEMTDFELSAAPVVQVWFQSAEGGDPIDVTDEALSPGMGDDGNQCYYDAGGQWHFNLKTSNYTSAGTYTVTLESGDDAEYLIDPTCETQFAIQ